MLSVLDRPRNSKDVPPELFLRVLGDELADASDVRLALDVEGRQVYIARGKRPDSICFMLLGHSGGGGGGGGCGDASNFTTTGAMIGVHRSSRHDGYVAMGVVPDGVTSVRVGDKDATLGENAFVIEVSSLDHPAVLTSSGGTRSVPLHLPTPPPSQGPRSESG